MTFRRLLAALVAVTFVPAVAVLGAAQPAEALTAGGKVNNTGGYSFWIQRDPDLYTHTLPTKTSSTAYFSDTARFSIPYGYCGAATLVGGTSSTKIKPGGYYRVYNNQVFNVVTWPASTC